MARIRDIQHSPLYGINPHLDRLESRLSKELEVVLDQEESLWLQKSRSQWIKDGDRNTRFYHMKIVTRRRKNKILAIRNSEGAWVEDQLKMKNMATNFYEELFWEDNHDREQFIYSVSYSRLDDGDLLELGSGVTLGEIKKAMFSMGSLKVPGEDGYPAIFFKRNWELVNHSLGEYIRHIWCNGQLVSSINNTLLVLIPKIDMSEFISQFRPIALCNTVYKCLTKIIVNRIKPLLSKCISPIQASFVLGRNIQDNIIIVHDLTHTMWIMKGRKGFMSIKIDPEKAYDCLSWNSIRQCLEDLSFPNHFVDVIMHYVTTPTFKILWNEDKAEQFAPSRGIRQGDPLSPYLCYLYGYPHD